MTDRRVPLAAGLVGAAAPRDLYPWYVAVVLCIAHVCSILDRYVMALVAELTKHDLLLSDVQLGLLQGTGFVIFFSIAGVPLGLLADRTNRRNLIIFGILVWSLATGASAFAHSFSALFVCRLFVGIGEACLLPAAMSLLAAYFDRRRLATGVSIFSSGIVFGKSAVFLVGGFFLSLLIANKGMTVAGLGHFRPWQGLFLIVATPGLLVALLLTTLREPARRDQSSSAVRMAQTMGHLRGHRASYLYIILGYTAVSMIAYASIAWAPSVFVRRYDLTVPQAAAIMGSIALLIGPIGYLVGGLLTDRLVARGVKGAPLLLLGILSGLVLLPLAVFCLAGSWRVAMAGYAVAQFLLSVSTPPGFTAIQMITPERLRGLVASLQTSVYSLISVGLGPPLIGFLADHVFRVHRTGLSNALLVVFVVAGAVAMLILFAGRTAFERSLAEATAMPDPLERS